jgi:hypothetical protein
MMGLCLPRRDRRFQSYARVAKSADAKDLKSFFAQAECGFKSRPGHQLAGFGTKVVRR